jgi:hypothetical protein
MIAGKRDEVHGRKTSPPRWVAIGLLVIALALVLAGIQTIAGYPALSAGPFAAGYLAAGNFALGIFAAGNFAAGLFAAGIFSIGVFSIGIFSIGVFAVGLFPIGNFPTGLAAGLYAAHKHMEGTKEPEKGGK